MSTPPVEPLRQDPDATPRPEEEVADAGRDVDDPQAQPVAGGSDDGPPAQGEGAPDSW